MEMEHDCFKKKLTASDVKRLAVTTAMLEMLPPVDPDRDIPIRVVDKQRHNKVYEFKLSCRQGGRNPVFQSRGWRMFVNDRGIAAGDLLYFSPEEDPVHGTQYGIALEKPNLFPHP